MQGLLALEKRFAMKLLFPYSFWHIECPCAFVGYYTN